MGTHTHVDKYTETKGQIDRETQVQKPTPKKAQRQRNNQTHQKQKTQEKNIQKHT